MKNLGILSFTLILLFLPTYFSAIEIHSMHLQKIQESQIIAIELEKAALQRKELEENTDFLIQITLQECLQKRELNPNKIKQEIIQELKQFFEKQEKIHPSNPKIEFFEGKILEKNYYSIKKTSKALAFEKIISVFSVDLGFGKSIVTAIFHGGIEKNKVVFAEIIFPYTKTLFVLPIEYTIIAIG